MNINSIEIKTNLQKSYDGDAARRDQSGKADWKIEERANFLDLIQNEGASTLLEIGAGPGYDSLFFSENGMDITATDLSPEMVKLCQEKGIQAYVRDFYDLGFSTNSFDAVWSLNCLLHVPSADLPKVLTSIKTVLTLGGLFFYGVYGGVDQEGVYENDHLDPKRWFTRYQDADLKEAVSSFFHIEYFKAIPLGDDDPGHFQAMILRKI